VGLRTVDADERFYLDTNTVIAIVERRLECASSQRDFLNGIDAGNIAAVSSDIALAECIVGPIRNGDTHALETFLSFFQAKASFLVLPISRDVVIRAAEIRARTGAKFPDAIHVASALVAQCSVFLSADKRLQMPKSMRRIAFDDLVFR
jgi:predicted nucleic acid-binding protein